MKIKVCIGESCHLQGAEDVVKTFKKNINSIERTDSTEGIQLKGCFCMNNCTKGRVSVLVEKEKFSLQPDDAEAFFNTHVTKKE